MLQLADIANLSLIKSGIAQFCDTQIITHYTATNIKMQIQIQMYIKSDISKITDIVVLRNRLREIQMAGSSFEGGGLIEGINCFTKLSPP